MELRIELECSTPFGITDKITIPGASRGRSGRGSAQRLSASQTRSRYREHRAAVAALQRDFFEELATRLKLAPDPTRRKVLAGLKRALADGVPMLRVEDEADLRAILQSGRFLSQFQTRTSGGAYDPLRRAAAEERTMGVPLGQPPADRPIYGHLGARDFAEIRSPSEELLSTAYGPIAVRLRPGIRARTTFVLGDSLDDQEQVVASRLDAPELISFPVRKEGAVKAARTLALPGESSVNRRTLQVEFGYIELHYHGGVAVEDVAEIALAVPPAPETLRLLEARKIRWRVIPTAVPPS